MKKSDLKTGYRVRLRNGQEFIVMLGTSRGDLLIKLKDDGWLDLEKYSDELHHIVDEFKDWSIVEVLAAEYNGYILCVSTSMNSLWKREESVPEYTMEELTNKLGHTFKIKK